ncbi:type VI secretion system tube protein TssD [Olivibacter ginsenosidimutans]
MKRKVLNTLLCMLFAVAAFGQQGDRKILLKLSNPKTKKTQSYELASVAYSFQRQVNDSLQASYLADNAYVISLELKKNADDFLLRWIGGEMNTLDGFITVEMEGVEKPLRTIAFKGGIANSTSESFTAGGSYDYSSTQLTLYVNNLTVDKVPMYDAQVKKPKNKVLPTAVVMKL